MLYHLFNSRLQPWVAQASVVVGIAFLLFFGVQGLLKSAPFGDDFNVFYTAGQLFLAGENPWQALQDSGTPFSYPPHSLGIFSLYGLLPFDVALTLHSYLNLVSIMLMAWVLNKWIFRIKEWNQLNLAQLLPLFLLVANFYMATSIHQGQTALPAAAAVLLSWYFLQRSQWVVAGVLLGLATIKPQLSLLYIVWLLMSWQLKPLIIGGIVALCLMIPSLITFGLVGSFETWLHSMSYYSTVAINAPGLPYVVGFESLLVAHGIRVWPAIFQLLALISLILMFWQRHRFNQVQTVHLFFVITFTFLYGHDYDYAAVIGLFSYLLYLSLTRPNLSRICLTVGILAIFFVPQRALRAIDLTILHHLRTLLLPLAAYLVWRWSSVVFETETETPMHITKPSNA